MAFHQDTGQEVAIKIVDKGSLLLKPEMATKLEREIAVMKLLHHPYVLTMLDVYEAQDKLYVNQCESVQIIWKKRRRFINWM